MSMRSFMRRYSRDRGNLSNATRLDGRRRRMMKMRMILAASTTLVLLADCEKAEAPAPGDMTTKNEAPVKTAPHVDTTTPGSPAAEPATPPPPPARRAGTWKGGAAPGRAQ